MTLKQMRETSTRSKKTKITADCVREVVPSGGKRHPTYLVDQFSAKRWNAYYMGATQPTKTKRWN
eukprot:12278991-Karenia_brevis.AAC.1